MGPVVRDLFAQLTTSKGETTAVGPGKQIECLGVYSGV